MFAQFLGVKPSLANWFNGAVNETTDTSATRPRKPAAIDSTATALHSLIAERWSTRSFDPSHQLSTADALCLAEAFRWAPSSNNSQPWRLALLRRGEAEFDEIMNSGGLTGVNPAWASRASALAICLAARKRKSGELWPQEVSWLNVGFASQQLMLQAAALGLHTRYMGGIDRDVIAKVLEVDTEEFDVVVTMAIGLQANSTEGLPDEIIEREQVARVRKSLDDILWRPLS
jgi:nitroreductase